MRTHAPALFVAGGLIIGTAVLSAFQTAQGPVFRSGVDVVQLDVSVLDRQRRPVRGLTAADFTVLEDGKPQRIVAVSEVTVERGNDRWPVWARSAAPDVASTEVGDKRILAIVIDGGGYNVGPILSGVMDRFVPGDVVAVIGGGCEVPFTEDLERVRACVDSLRNPVPRPRVIEPPRPINPRDPLPHNILRDVVEYLSAVPQRRKAVIYLGNGFRPPPMRSMSRGGRGAPNGPSDAERRNEEDYRATLWFAHQANVNIYTVNDVSTRLSINGASYRPSDSLKSLAEETGGIFIGATEPLSVGLDQLFLENGSYYLVGYQTSNPSMDGKSRKLSVKVNQQDLTVRSRTLLYRPKPSSLDSTSAADVPSRGLSKRLRDWMPNIDVGFDAIAMPFAEAGNARPVVAIVTGLTEPVPPGTTRVVQHTDVRCLIYDDRGTVVTDQTKRVELDVAPSIDNRVRYDVLQDVALAPGRYSLRFTAHNADTDKVGAIEFSVLVPDFAKDPVSLSGVAISAASTEPMRRVGSIGPLLPTIPTAVRRFPSSDTVTAYVRVHEGGQTPFSAATLDAKILNSAGEQVFVAVQPIAAERFEGSGMAEYQMKLPLDTLKPGYYLLTLQATRGSRKTLPRDVRFTIR